MYGVSTNHGYIINHLLVNNTNKGGESFAIIRQTSVFHGGWRTRQFRKCITNVIQKETSWWCLAMMIDIQKYFEKKMNLFHVGWRQQGRRGFEMVCEDTNHGYMMCTYESIPCRLAPTRAQRVWDGLWRHKPWIYVCLLVNNTNKGEILINQ